MLTRGHKNWKACVTVGPAVGTKPKFFERNAFKLALSDRLKIHFVLNKYQTNLYNPARDIQRH